MDGKEEQEVSVLRTRLASGAKDALNAASSRNVLSASSDSRTSFVIVADLLMLMVTSFVVNKTTFVFVSFFTRGARGRAEINPESGVPGVFSRFCRSPSRK